MAKTLKDILGEDLPFQNSADRKFTELHKIEKIRGLSEPTDDDKVFNATNITPATIKKGPGKDPMVGAPFSEGVMDVYGGVAGAGQDQDDADAQRNAAIQQNMDASSQYKQQMKGHMSLAQNHNQVGQDMNQDTKLRNLHKNAADLHNQLNTLYGRLSKYHDGQMQAAINGDDQ